ncbi:hypothetical protein ACFFRR_001449 [Megaselia abdita]
MEITEKSFSLNKNRFVVEDSMMKVTMDGEAHGMMTLAAASAGMVMAFIILGVLISFLLYSRRENEAHVKELKESEASISDNNIPELFSIAVIGNDNKGFVSNETEERKGNVF